ncbi:MAG: PAS domain S-box protein [Burkholderiales bacterium]|nr:PAS domain S-box protein [Burkholderiales bacterium]
MNQNKPTRQRLPPGIGINLAIIAFNALLIAAAWIAVLEVARIDREETIKAAIDRNNNLAIAFEQYTVRTVESADSVIQYMIRDYLRSGGKLDLDRFVADYTISDKAFAGIVLADEHGNVATTAHTSKPEKPVNVADREHFRVHLTQDTGMAFVGKPVTGRVTGKPVIPITRRINKPDGSFGGVAMVLIEPVRLTDLQNQARMKDLDIITLIGTDGIIRARLKGTSTTAGEDVSKSPVFKAYASSPNGHYFAKGQIDGIAKFFSYRTLPGYQLISLVASAESDVLANFSRRQHYYFWAAGITSILIATFTALLIIGLTRQRQAAASVARSQARFLATFNQAAVGIAHSDLEGRCLELNQKLCDITGYTRNELLGRKFTDITHPDDVAASDEFRRRVVAESKAFNSLQREKRYIRKDGSIIWCLLTTSAVRDDAGHIDYLAAVIQDISESKKAEQALRALEQEQRLLAQQAEAERTRLAEAQAVAKIGSWETRFPDLAMIWSAETYRIFETDANRFQPTHPAFLAIVHPDDRASVDATFANSLKDRLPHSIEHRIVMADGRVKIVEERWRVFFDDQQQPVRAVGTCQDITDQKKAEQDRAQLAAIVESSNDAIISRSLDGFIISWNRAAERMFGWTAAEVIGQRSRIITPPDYFRKFTHVLQRVKEGETADPFETVRMRKDGSLFDAQVCLSAVKDDNGRVIAIANIVRDITDRKLAETALRDHAAQMRHLSWRLSEVEERERRDIHRELHDQIGANLSALKLDLNLIGSMLAADAPPTVCDRLQKAQQLTGEIIVRIRDVMADLRPPALDDYGLLAALRSCAQPFAMRLGIPLMVDGDDIQPRLVIAVETALFRIAQEAINNIAKHAKARYVGITITATDRRVTLVVADDGVGFDAADPRQPGWGLRTMRERAQAIAADLRIESAPGRGTRIIVDLAREAA